MVLLDKGIMVTTGVGTKQRNGNGYPTEATTFSFSIAKMVIL